MTTPIRIEAGTDVAMIGIWDHSWDATPLPKRGTIPELEAAADERQLWLVKTLGDGSYEADIYVDQQADVDELEDRRVVGDWRALHVPSGKLCFSGVEDFRTAKKQITGEDAYFEVTPGEYRVRAQLLDLDIPERKLAESVGEEDYEYWKPRDATDMTIFGFFLLALLSSLIGGIWLDWRLGVGLAALGILLYWLIGAGRRRDERFQRIQDRVHDVLGDKTLDDLIEDFVGERPMLVIELQRLGDGDAPASTGAIELWTYEV